MEDLVESILDYIRADYTDYAIMINGEWGSGKTHFWNICGRFQLVRPPVALLLVQLSQRQCLITA